MEAYFDLRELRTGTIIESLTQDAILERHYQNAFSGSWVVRNPLTKQEWSLKTFVDSFEQIHGKRDIRRSQEVVVESWHDGSSEPVLTASLKKDIDKIVIALDTEIPRMVSDGRTMAAIVEKDRLVAQFDSIHDFARELHSLLVKNTSFLTRLNSPVALNLVDEGLSEEALEGLSRTQESETSPFLRRRGIDPASHPILGNRLRALRYYLWRLRRVIENDFVPTGWTSPGASEVKKPTRHISDVVRREVWRRDEGRCVECGSIERLEYDHIIPHAKGGSNTERNIRLLCESCNRRKSATV